MPKDEFFVEDPMELVGMVMPGNEDDLEMMAECIVDEYIRLGWGEERLMNLFTNPMFLGTHRIYRYKGEDYVRDLIQRTKQRWHP
ncbi:MAG: hypothetical protein ACNA8H_01975 [Anaerolineales bacterium]